MESLSDLLFSLLVASSPRSSLGGLTKKLVSFMEACKGLCHPDLDAKKEADLLIV